MKARVLLNTWPPSTNAIWRAAGRSKSVILSEAARRFFRRAPWELKAGCGGHRFDGPVCVTLTLHPPNRRRYDLDNCAKAVLDAITKAGIWEDDDQVRRLIMEKGSVREGGCVVVEITEYGKREAQAETAEETCTTEAAGWGRFPGS